MSIAKRIFKPGNASKIPIREMLTKKDNDMYMHGPIVVEYSYNYPINELQDIIVNRIQSNNDELDIQEKIQELEERLQTTTTVIEERAVRDCIAKLQTKLQDLLSGAYLNAFLRDTQPIINEYLSFHSITQEVSFVDDVAEEVTQKIVNLDERMAKISDIVDSYLNVASRYVDLEVNRKINTNVDECYGCDYDMSDVYVQDNGEQVCPVCKTVRYKYNMTGHKGIKNFAGSRLYDVQVTFRRELLQFQGKGKVHIPEEVYTLLDEYFQSLGKPSAEEIRKMEPDEYGKKPGTSRALLDDGLQIIGYPSLYKHANKIGKKLWGWKLWDLSEITPLIMKDFNTLQAHFPYVDKGNRSSNTCSQARLLQHLRYRDVHVALTDFKLPGTASLVANENIFRQMCLRAGMEYKPLFPNIHQDEKEVGITLITKCKAEVHLYDGE